MTNIAEPRLTPIRAAPLVLTQPLQRLFTPWLSLGFSAGLVLLMQSTGLSDAMGFWGLGVMVLVISALSGAIAYGLVSFGDDPQFITWTMTRLDVESMRWRAGLHDGAHASRVQQTIDALLESQGFITCAQGKSLEAYMQLSMIARVYSERSRFEAEPA